MLTLSVLALVLAPSPVDTLLARVPADTALCVVVRDLRGTAARVGGSPFARWLAESKLVETVVPPDEVRKLREAERFLADKLGSTPQQLLDDVFGDAVVLAYRPGPPESGVVLLHARDPQRLAATLDKLNALQTESGELKGVTERSHAGKRYRVRTRADGGTEFVYCDGPVLAFTAQEDVLKAVLDGKGGSPIAASLRRLGVADAPVVAWFHPPALPADGPAAKVWAACDGLALWLRLDERLTVGVTAAVDASRLPGPMRAALERPAGGSAWGAVPADALVAVGGRLDVPGALAAVDASRPATEALGPILGKANVTPVLAGIGPEWVAWAEAPKVGWVPDWTAAVKLAPAARKPVLGALDLGAGLVRLAYNRDHADSLEVVEKDGVKALVGGLPQRPAFGMSGDYLVLASSPERVSGFKVAGEVTNPPVARLDAIQLRRFLTDKRDELAKGLAAQDGKPVAEVLRDLDGLGLVLQVVNRVELRQSAGDGLLRLTLDIEPVKPLAGPAR